MTGINGRGRMSYFLIVCFTPGTGRQRLRNSKRLQLAATPRHCSAARPHCTSRRTPRAPACRGKARLRSILQPHLAGEDSNPSINAAACLQLNRCVLDQDLASAEAGHTQEADECSIGPLVRLACTFFVVARPLSNWSQFI